MIGNSHESKVSGVVIDQTLHNAFDTLEKEYKLNTRKYNQKKPTKKTKKPQKRKTKNKNKQQNKQTTPQKREREKKPQQKTNKNKTKQQTNTTQVMILCLTRNSFHAYVIHHGLSHFRRSAVFTMTQYTNQPTMSHYVSSWPIIVSQISIIHHDSVYKSTYYESL